MNPRIREPQTLKPLIVLIDGLQYSRYYGTLRLDRVRSDRPLTPEEVESFRLNPKALLEAEPECA